MRCKFNYYNGFSCSQLKKFNHENTVTLPKLGFKDLDFYIF